MNSAVLTEEELADVEKLVSFWMGSVHLRDTFGGTLFQIYQDRKKRPNTVEEFRKFRNAMDLAASYYIMGKGEKREIAFPHRVRRRAAILLREKYDAIYGNHGV